MMEDIQRAIEMLENEIKILNNTPVHVNKLQDVVDAVWARKIAIYSMQELQQYWEIGTLEECREAMTKQSIVHSVNTATEITAANRREIAAAIERGLKEGSGGDNE